MHARRVLGSVLTALFALVVCFTPIHAGVDVVGQGELYSFGVQDAITDDLGVEKGIGMGVVVLGSHYGFRSQLGFTSESQGNFMGELGFILRSTSQPTEGYF